MLRWALIFFLVAIVAAVLGFSKLVNGAESIAMALFWVFLAVTVVLFLVGLVGGRKGP